MIKRMTQEQLQALKERMGPETRKFAEGIEQRADPGEMGDMIALLTLLQAAKRSAQLEPGQLADIVRECLTLVRASTFMQTCQFWADECADAQFARLLTYSKRFAFDEMRASVQKISVLNELLKPSNAEV